MDKRLTDKSNVCQPKVWLALASQWLTARLADQDQKGTPWYEIYHQQHQRDNWLRSDEVGDSFTCTENTGTSNSRSAGPEI